MNQASYRSHSIGETMRSFAAFIRDNRRELPLSDPDEMARPTKRPYIFFIPNPNAPRLPDRHPARPAAPRPVSIPSPCEGGGSGVGVAQFSFVKGGFRGISGHQKIPPSPPLPKGGAPLTARPVPRPSFPVATLNELPRSTTWGPPETVVIHRASQFQPQLLQRTMPGKASLIRSKEFAEKCFENRNNYKATSRGYPGR